MKNNEVIEIKKLLDSINRSDLLNELMLKRSYLEINKILNMPEWKNNEYKGLLTSTIWNSNYEDINKIIHMPEWEDIKYKNLLTPTIWNSNYEEINKIIHMPEWEDEKFSSLLTTNIWKSNYEEINKIIHMPEWNDGRFKKLLTPTIWKSSYQAILTKLYLPYWNETKYQHLLTPSIFSVSVLNIKNGIELLKKYGVDRYITNKCLRLNTDTLKDLIEYLVDNNIDLITYNERTGKLGLNPIISCEKGQLKKKYDVDIKKIESNNKSI